ncbi:cysteine proteinase, partial [Basidiobolus meristosporus CBS 931.73]
PQPTLETLRQLHFAALTKFPFENLSLHCTESRIADITPQGMYRRQVLENRGGYCYQLNGLFYLVLERIGFKVYPCSARIAHLLEDGATEYGRLSHRISIAIIDGEKYICDIGFGTNGFFFPLPVLNDQPANELNGAAISRLVQKIHPKSKHGASVGWEFQHWQGDRWMPDYFFVDEEAYESDFEVGNYYTSLNQKSIFKRMIRVFRSRRDGSRVSIEADKLKVRWGADVKERRTLRNERERVDALRDYFGYNMSEEERQ